MALINCRECHKEISSEARICPHCGAAKKKRPGFLRNALYTGVIIFGLLFIIGTLSGPKDGAATAVSGPPPSQTQIRAQAQAQAQAEAQRQAQAQASAQRQAQAFDFEATPAELAASYDANTVAADNQYKGKRYKVTGVVDSINTGFGGGAYITMKGGNPFVQPQFALEDSEKGAAAALKKGQTASVICTGAGDIAKTPMSRKCVFSSPS